MKYLALKNQSIQMGGSKKKSTNKKNVLELNALTETPSQLEVFGYEFSKISGGMKEDNNEFKKDVNKLAKLLNDSDLENKDELSDLGELSGGSEELESLSESEDKDSSSSSDKKNKDSSSSSEKNDVKHEDKKDVEEKSSSSSSEKNDVKHEDKKDVEEKSSSSSSEKEEHDKEEEQVGGYKEYDKKSKKQNRKHFFDDSDLSSDSNSSTTDSIISSLQSDSDF